LVYSDGSPLTAERFRYAIARQCDPHEDFFDVSALFVIAGCKALNSSLHNAAGTPVDDEEAFTAAQANLGVHAPDDRTLAIELERPAPYFPSIAGGSGFLPVKQELVEAGGPEWWLDAGNWVGNGPFKVTAIERDATVPRLAFARNEHYWGGPAKLDGIEYVVMDSEPALEAYRRDELDIISAPLGVMSLGELEADPALSRELLVAPIAMTGVFLLNQTREPFTDKKVREAFAYAFDRETYSILLEGGSVTPTLSWIPPGIPGAIETDAYAFNPAKARQALAESSYGGPEGLPEIVWYAIPNEDPWFARRDQWVIDQFRQVLGVEMVQTTVTEEEFDAMLWVDQATWPQIGSYIWYSDLPDPHDWLGFWTCDSEAFAKYIGYCNPAFDDLAARVDSELDPEKREALTEEASRMLVADAPSIFAYNPTNAWLVKPYVTGYSRTASNQQWPGWWTPLTVDVVRTE
jgi:oligopeptide transport system substrate-binding protein